MKVGISTASLFGRFKTEDGLKFLSDNKIDVAEVFLESYCEYNKKHSKKSLFLLQLFIISLYYNLVYESNYVKNFF